MCGSCGGGGRLSYATNSVAGRVSVGSCAPAQQIEYEVTHPDRSVHKFSTDSEAYGDLRKHPGSGMRVVRVAQG